MKNILLKTCIISLQFLILSNIFGQDLKERINQWEADLRQLENIIISKHINAFTKISKDEFRKDMNMIKAKIGNLNDNQIKIQLSQLIAKIGDSHTSLSYPPESLFPFSFEWFEDGIFMINGGKDQAEFLGKKIVEIAGLSIDSVIKSMSQIIPHENLSQLKVQIPIYLIRPDVLSGLGIIKDISNCDYTFIDSIGNKKTTTVKAIQKTEFGNFFRQMEWVERKKHPIKDRKSKLPYWFEIIDSVNTIYINYSKCRDIEEYPFSQFTTDIMRASDSLISYKLIIDLRQNGGGNSGVFLPLINEIIKRNHLNKAEKLKVLVGEKTFSSAVLNAIDLRNQTNAVFIGEPSRGKPNHFGEIIKEKLNNYNITISYSIKYFKHIDGDPDSFYPEQIIHYSFSDFILGKDPVLNHAIGLN